MRDKSFSAFALGLTLCVCTTASAIEEEALLVSSYEPTYFVVGRHDSTTARFQFSFKYKLFDADSIPAQIIRPLTGLHFAYTQAAIWDLSSDSKPFRDTNYRPSFLYQWISDDIDGGMPVWRVLAGAEHESNGRDLPRSRSINTLFFYPSRRIDLGRGRFMTVGAKLYGYTDREENADIIDFRGIGNYEVSFGKTDAILVRSMTRIGKSGRGSLQLDVSYPLRRQYFANTGGYIYVQYFNGYGETLLDYNVRRPQQLRIGFGIVR